MCTGVPRSYEHADPPAPPYGYGPRRRATAGFLMSEVPLQGVGGIPHDVGEKDGDQVVVLRLDSPPLRA